MKVTQFARQVGVNKDSVRYYERLGLLQSQRATNGYRDYRSSDQADLQLILGLRQLDFSLKEIALVLQLKRREQSQNCQQATQDFLQQKIKRLQQHSHFLQAATRIMVDLQQHVQSGSGPDLADYLDQLGKLTHENY